MTGEYVDDNKKFSIQFSVGRNFIKFESYAQHKEEFLVKFYEWCVNNALCTPIRDVPR